MPFLPPLGASLLLLFPAMERQRSYMFNSKIRGKWLHRKTQEAYSSTCQTKYPMKLRTAESRFTRTRSCRFPRTRSCPSPWPVTKQQFFKPILRIKCFTVHLWLICLWCELHLTIQPIETLRSLKLQSSSLSWSLPTCSHCISHGPSAAFPGAEGLRKGSIKSAGKCQNL